MARRTRRDVLSAFRCEEILRAARQVFGEKGFARAGIHEIARAAGIAKGTIYLYYPSKEAVYWAALRSGLRELLAEVAARMREETSFEDKLRAFAETKIRYFDDHRDFFRIYHAEVGNALTRPAATDQEFTRIYRDQVELLASVVRAAVRHKEIRRVPAARAAAAIFEVTRGLIVQRLMTKPAASAGADAGFVVDLVSKGLRTP
jgi:AcrR family transcriptional regulator